MLSKAKKLAHLFTSKDFEVPRFMRLMRLKMETVDEVLMDTEEKMTKQSRFWGRNFREFVQVKRRQTCGKYHR